MHPLCPRRRAGHPWTRVLAFRAIVIEGTGWVVEGMSWDGRVRGTVVVTLVTVVGGIVVVTFVTMVGIAVSFPAGVPVGGGPVVGTVVTTVVCVTTGVVSTGVTGVVAGAGVVTAGGRVMMTMVGVGEPGC